MRPSFGLVSRVYHVHFLSMDCVVTVNLTNAPVGCVRRVRVVCRFPLALHSRVDVAQRLHASALRPRRRPPPIGRRLRQQPPR